jgi:hypothetical protein
MGQHEPCYGELLQIISVQLDTDRGTHIQPCIILREWTIEASPVKNRGLVRLFQLEQPSIICMPLAVLAQPEIVRTIPLA